MSYNMVVNSDLRFELIHSANATENLATMVEHGFKHTRAWNMEQGSQLDLMVPGSLPDSAENGA